MEEKEKEDKAHDLEFLQEKDGLESLEKNLSEGFSPSIEEEFMGGLNQESSDSKVKDQTPEKTLELSEEEALSIIESILFVSDRPVGLTALKEAFSGTSYKSKEIKVLLERLRLEYQNPQRGITLEEVSGAYQIRTKSINQTFIKKTLKTRTFRLTGPSLEVLAIVAYSQPCIKSQVDEVRGVESGHLIRALMDKGLVAFSGKSDLPGRPMLYQTTRKFLEIFGLRNLSELPSLSEIEELLPEGIEGERDGTLSDVANKLKESYANKSYSVGEKDLVKITEELSQISTSTEFFEKEKKNQKEVRDRERWQSLRKALDLGEIIHDKSKRWLERYELENLQPGGFLEKGEKEGTVQDQTFLKSTLYETDTIEKIPEEKESSIEDPALSEEPLEEERTIQLEKSENSEDLDKESKNSKKDPLDVL